MQVKKGALRHYLERKGLIKSYERIPNYLLEKIKNAKDHSIKTISRNKKKANVRITPTLKRRVTFALNFRKKRR